MESHGRTLAYSGTDGNGEWLLSHGFEWEGNDLGRMVLYRGNRPNINHDAAFRRKYHEPLFRREMTKFGATAVVEWWITNPKPEPAFWDEPIPYAGRNFTNLLHYDPADSGIWRSLETLTEEDRLQSQKEDVRATFAAAPDLAGTSTRGIVVETVLGANRLSPTEWDRAWLQVHKTVRAVAQATRS